MTRLASCNAPSKSLRSYRRRARPSGSVCANAECAQEKNKTTTKIQVHLFILIIPSKSNSSRRELEGQYALHFYRLARKLCGLKYPQTGGGQRGFAQKGGTFYSFRFYHVSFFGNQNEYFDLAGNSGRFRIRRI